MTNEVRFLIQRALKGSETLPPCERARLYEAIGQITRGRPSLEARRMAFWHRELVFQQRTFLSALFGKARDRG